MKEKNESTQHPDPKIIEESKTIIIVRRPSGIEEEVDVSRKYPLGIPDRLLDHIRTATRDAGRGEVIRAIYTPAILAPSTESYYCARCGQKIDPTITYHQLEPYLWGGKPVPVIQYYCDDCHRYLSQVGMGEYSELDRRRYHD